MNQLFRFKHKLNFMFYLLFAEILASFLIFWLRKIGSLTKLPDASLSPSFNHNISAVPLTSGSRHSECLCREK